MPSIFRIIIIIIIIIINWTPLPSSDQSSLLQIQRFRVRVPDLPDFTISNGSGTGSIQPRDDNWGGTWKNGSGFGLENRDWLPWGPVDLTTPHRLPAPVGTSFADRAIYLLF
jgi:hypothetical protein